MSYSDSNRFCHEKLQQDWKSTIRDCSLGTTLAFLHYIHTEDRVTKRGAMQQYIAQFKMLYNRMNGRQMNTNDGKKALKVCYSLVANELGIPNDCLVY